MPDPINAELRAWALMALSSIFVIALVAFAVVGGIAFSKVQKGAGKSFGLLFQRGNFLRIITAVAVIQAAAILSLAGALTEGATAILSAVAGFVLGGLDKASSQAGNEAVSHGDETNNRCRPDER